jgi:phytoene desaturase
VKHAVVIGGGLGGLAAGLRLSRSGYQVTICEAGPRMGGKMNRWVSGGFTFDTGPSLITMPWVFEETFTAAGGQLAEHVQLMPLETLADYRYADGTCLTHSSQLPEWIATLERVAPRDREGFFDFMRLGARLYEVSSRTFLQHTPYERPGKESVAVLRHFPFAHAWGNYHQAVAAHFHSPYLQQLFDRYPTYVGSSPYRSPATLAVVPYLEYTFGGYAVRGGLYRIVEGLIALAQRNHVQLLVNSRVSFIESNGGHVTGVRLADGQRLPGDVVVMNGDAALTPQLLGDPPATARDRSLSGFVMLLGIGHKLPGLGQHTVCFSADYRREFTELFDQQSFPEDPTVYVNAPSRGDASVAPPWGETLFIMANAPATGSSWTLEQIETARQRVLQRLQKSGFPDISNDIRVSDIWTPDRIENAYDAPGGSIYGTDSHGWKNAFLRPPNRNRRLRGLYHVGGSTHPGGGTPTVLLSAKITCGLIARDIV